MDHIILIRRHDIVTAISDGYNIFVFPDLDVAVELAETHILCQQFPYQIVELDKL